MTSDRHQFGQWSAREDPWAEHREAALWWTSAMIRLERNRAGAPTALRDEAARLERLASDLRRIADEGGPTGDDLAGAARLEEWGWSTRPVACLVGLGTGHPAIPAGPITTTDVWSVDEQAGWARTLGRWYVLGTPTRR